MSRAATVLRLRTAGAAVFPPNAVVRILAGPALVLTLLSASSSNAPAQQIRPEHYAPLIGRHIGPVGNRVASVAGVPGDRLTYYVGAASGGIWKTTDAGITWRPMFDDQPVHAVGTLAVSRSDPAIVWAGTGEPHIRSNVSIGNGVWKSTDAGETWAHMGLEGTGRIARVIIHPADPDIVYAGVMGHGYAPQSERGVWRTTDGGDTWNQVFHVSDDVGVSDLVMDPNNPRILFAGMWNFELKTWVRESGGPGSGIYTSRDGGDTWTRVEDPGLPRPPIGKIGLCMTPGDSQRIYALIETGDGVPWKGQDTDTGELWRSDDGGKSWQLVNHDRSLGGRTGYYNHCAVSTDDPDEAYFLTASFARTTDGGPNAETIPRRNAPGGDHHDMWIDPGNGDRMIVGHDQGLSISENRGASWFRVQLPIGQMYHVTVDTKIPYNVYGNRQDGPSTMGPSNSRTSGNRGGNIPRGMWHAVGGGESGFATPDPVEPDVVWSSASGSGARGGIVVRYDERTRQYDQVEVWPESTGGWPAAELKYRFQWTFPLLISPHDHNTIYVTSQHVHRTRNRGYTWEVISPDLTTNDKSKQTISGGLTPDNIGVEYCCVIYAFDESPVTEGVFWAGSNDGLVHVSRDGGETWTDVTANIPDLPTDGVVRNIDASRWDAGKAYMTVEFHQVGNFSPYVYRTEDYGQSWTRITNGIADSPLSYTRNVHEDPVRPGLLYLGTENALYVSFDDGGNWQPFMTNLPAAPYYWLVVQEHFNDLVIGTYGRGFWIVDDVTPLQQLTPEVASSPVHLFQPRDAYRFRTITSPWAQDSDPTAGMNPPYGASINYWLGSVPSGQVTLTISDESGEVIRTLTGTGDEGINRVWWDLETEPSNQIKLRTHPLYADWVPLNDERWRPIPQGRISALAPPGTYTVTLSVDGQEHTRALTVLKDPNSEGTEADIAEQTAMMLDLREDMNRTGDMIDRIEWIRRQIYDVQSVLEDQGGADDVIEAGNQLDADLIEVEEKLFQMRLTGTGQDGVRWPAKIVGRLNHLANGVAEGDFQPTDSEREVHGVLKSRIDAAQAELAEVLRTGLVEFNQMLRSRAMTNIISEQP